METVENAKRPRIRKPRAGPGLKCTQAEDKMEIMLKYAGARLAAGIAEDILGLLVLAVGLLLVLIMMRTPRR